MKTLALLAVALVALAGLVGCTTTQPPNASAGTGVALSPRDEAAVRATLAEYDNTWNHRDLKGMRELLTEDVQWIRVSGNVWRGKGKVYPNASFDATTPPLSSENIEVRSLAPQVVVAVAIMKYGKVLLPSGQEVPEFHTRNSFVMAKRGGAWKIVHFHHSRLDPGVEKNDPLWGETSFRPEKKEARSAQPFKSERKPTARIAKAEPTGGSTQDEAAVRDVIVGPFGPYAAIVLSPQDEAAVRATLAEFDNTWNHHDMKRMRELVTEDAHWILANGNVWRGNQEVYTGYDVLHRSFDAESPMRTLSTGDIEARALAPQVAAAVAIMKYGKGLSLSGQEVPELNQRGSFVMAKRGGTWKIVHFHATTLHPSIEEHERLMSSIGSKREKIKTGVEKWQNEGRDPSAIAELMQQFDALAKDGKFKSSEAALDKALDLLGDNKK